MKKKKKKSSVDGSFHALPLNGSVLLGSGKNEISAPVPPRVCQRPAISAEGAVITFLARGAQILPYHPALVKLKFYLHQFETISLDLSLIGLSSNSCTSARKACLYFSFSLLQGDVN